MTSQGWLVGGGAGPAIGLTGALESGNMCLECSRLNFVSWSAEISLETVFEGTTTNGLVLKVAPVVGRHLRRRL